MHNSEQTRTFPFSRFLIDSPGYGGPGGNEAVGIISAGGLAMLRILVVDDDPVELHSMQLWLTQHGFDVTTADGVGAGRYTLPGQTVQAAHPPYDHRGLPDEEAARRDPACRFELSCPSHEKLSSN